MNNDYSEKTDSMINVRKGITEKTGELFGFIFPVRCIGCSSLLEDTVRKDAGGFCDICKISVEERGDNFCPVCGVRHTGITGESVCSECIKNPKPFERLFYRFLYGGAMGDAVTSFKYSHNLFAGRFIATESVRFLYDEILKFSPDLIIPVPLHFLKYLIRSFSPTAYIASLLSDILKIPVRYDVLRKIRYTRAQVGLDREQRLKNLKDSFDVSPKKMSLIEGKNILLVDDVYTTGATASLCAGLLKKSGAGSVTLFVLARGE